VAGELLPGLTLRAATPDDAPAIAAIYAQYVTGSAISFELEAPSAAEMRGRIEAVAGRYPWIVAEAGDASLAGYAYACAFRPRAAYRFAVETTVYLHPGATGRGLGSALYRPLLRMLEAQRFTQAIAAIALPNPASVRLHERLGFAAAGTYARVGYKLGRWLDVGLWQRSLAVPTEPPEEPLPLDALGDCYLG
jgi:L-amino acid N-acyltransferase YncA